MYTIDCEIEGNTDLLQHRFAIEGDDDGKIVTGKPDYTEEWRKALYIDHENNVVQPAIHIERSMVKAAVNIKIPGKRGKTYKDLFNAAVFVHPDLIPYGVSAPDELSEHANGPMYVSVMPVIVNRARVLRYRPALRAGWRLAFQIEVQDDEIPIGVVQKILELAGQRVGIGDYRPRYGRFRIARFDLLQ